MPKHHFGKATCESASTLPNLAPADRRSAVGEVTNPTPPAEPPGGASSTLAGGGPASPQAGRQAARRQLEQQQRLGICIIAG